MANTVQTQINHGEYCFCRFVRNEGSKFYQHIISAMLVATGVELEKLKRVYPHLAQTVRDYRFLSGYWKDLVDRWNNEHPEAIIFT